MIGMTATLWQAGVLQMTATLWQAGVLQMTATLWQGGDCRKAAKVAAGRPTESAGKKDCVLLSVLRMPLAAKRPSCERLPADEIGRRSRAGRTPRAARPV
jgi:hypothetical protein